MQNKSMMSESIITHGDLAGRDLPEQHPISAITGLRDSLLHVALGRFFCGGLPGLYEEGQPVRTGVRQHFLHNMPATLRS